MGTATVVTEARPRGRDADKPTEIPPRGGRTSPSASAGDQGGPHQPGGGRGRLLRLPRRDPRAGCARLRRRPPRPSPGPVTRRADDLFGSLPDRGQGPAHLPARDARRPHEQHPVAEPDRRHRAVAVVGVERHRPPGRGRQRRLRRAATTRGFVKKKAVALAFTLGAVALRRVRRRRPDRPAGDRSTPSTCPGWLGGLLQPRLLARPRDRLRRSAWPCSTATVPTVTMPKWRWVSWGSVVAVVVWLVASVLFRIYAANFGSYDQSYGSLAAVVVLLLWLYITAFVVLLGAQINAEMEHQTAVDTTRGPDRPLGQRGAVMADTIGQQLRPPRRTRTAHRPPTRGRSPMTPSTSSTVPGTAPGGSASTAEEVKAQTRDVADTATVRSRPGRSGGQVTDLAPGRRGRLQGTGARQRPAVQGRRVARADVRRAGPHGPGHVAARRLPRRVRPGRARRRRGASPNGSTVTASTAPSTRSSASPAASLWPSSPAPSRRGWSSAV